MKCQFHVGQKVVCIREGCEADGFVEGRVYTVSAIGMAKDFIPLNSRFFGDYSAIGIQLSEITWPFQGRDGDWYTSVDPKYFRPLHDTTAQVEAIKRKALNSPVREPEEA